LKEVLVEASCTVLLAVSSRAKTYTKFWLISVLLIFVLLLSVNAANSRPGTINSTHVKCLLAEFEVDLQSVKSHATS